MYKIQYQVNRIDTPFDDNKWHDDPCVKHSNNGKNEFETIKSACEYLITKDSFYAQLMVLNSPEANYNFINFTSFRIVKIP